MLILSICGSQESRLTACPGGAPVRSLTRACSRTAPVTVTSRPCPWHLYSLTMRMLLRAKIGCDERSALMSLTSPVGGQRELDQRLALLDALALRFARKATSPITVVKFEQTTPADTGRRRGRRRRRRGGDDRRRRRRDHHRRGRRRRRRRGDRRLRRRRRRDLDFRRRDEGRRRRLELRRRRHAPPRAAAAAS